MTSEDKLGNDTPNEALAAKRRAEKSKKFADAYGGSGKLLKPETPERVRAQNAVFAEKFGKIDSVRAEQAEHARQAEDRLHRKPVPIDVTEVDVDDLIKPNDQLLNREQSEKLAETMAKPTVDLIEEAAKGDPGELEEFLDTKLGEPHITGDELLKNPIGESLISRELVQKGLETLKRMNEDPESFNLGESVHLNGTEELSVDEIFQLWADADSSTKKLDLKKILCGRLNMGQDNMQHYTTLADGRTLCLRWYHDKRTNISFV